MALTHIDIPSLEKLASGKVRDLYALPSEPSQLLFVSTDRLSAFDVVMANGIPHKGAILTLLSAHWFRVLPTLVPNLRTHFISLDIPSSLLSSGESESALKSTESESTTTSPLLTPTQASLLRNRSMLVRRLRVLKLEAIVRGYITGSAWTEYQSHGTIHTIPMPANLRLSEKLDPPLFTPSTKADAGAHDVNIYPDDAWKELGGDEATARDLAKRVQALALDIYTAAARYAEQRGIIIADTKFEFAVDDADGALYLVDEVLTPDSSRFWPLEDYKVGHEQQSFDKQFVRNWLIREGLKGKLGVTVPDDICKATEERYKDVFFKLTGSSFDHVAAQSS